MVLAGILSGKLLLFTLLNISIDANLPASVSNFLLASGVRRYCKAKYPANRPRSSPTGTYGKTDVALLIIRIAGPSISSANAPSMLPSLFPSSSVDVYRPRTFAIALVRWPGRVSPVCRRITSILPFSVKRSKYAFCT